MGKDLPEHKNPFYFVSKTDRRDFLKICLTAAASIGLSATAGVRIAEAAAAGVLRPSVIWLHFQECTGCTETLLRSSHPDVGKLILEMISLDYHETLLAASGYQAEAALHETMEARKGEYILVVEGSIPTKDGGVYCKIAGKTAMDSLAEVSKNAAAVIAIGSCASFGGLAAAEPNPTGAVGVSELVKDKAIVNIPGCPPNPYNFLGTVLQYVVLGTLPELDAELRPTFAYGRTIHEHCPRRAHFDAGRFAEKYGDDNHKQGYCLYKIGCKGPATGANCSTRNFGDTDSWPIGVGHPCIGCTEKNLLWRTALHDTVDIEHPTGPATYPPIVPEREGISPVATGVAGLVGGALIGAGVVAAKKLENKDDDNQKEV
ncbi:MAG: hydrogenase small subunit [bacterium]|nr:hydrogenase small subunit [bacterium]MCP4800761.1 hydrogenase small subunit [bacterium]